MDPHPMAELPATIVGDDFDPVETASPPARPTAVRYPLSHSRLQEIDGCHRRYWYRRVAEVPLAQEIVGISPYAFGSLFHDRMAAALIGTIIELRLGYASTFCPERWAQRFTAHVVPPSMARKWQRVSHVMAAWMRRYGAECWAQWASPTALPLVEWPVALDHHGAFADWSGDARAAADERLQFRGLLDFAVVWPDDHAQLWDWKTSARYRFVPRDGTGRLSPQLGIYAYCLFRRFPQLRGVLATYFNVCRHAPEPPAWITREEADRFGPQWMASVVNQIAAKDPAVAAEWHPRPNPYCGFCDFEQLCPAQRLNRYQQAREAILADLLIGESPLSALPDVPPRFAGQW